MDGVGASILEGFRAGTVPGNAAYDDRELDRPGETLI
jgi:hypothetical protein